MKVSKIDLNLLVVLDAILRTQSVTRAARELGISKAAMSHALSRLRKQTADPVLVRVGSSWQLSERAIATKERVRELVDGARAVLSPAQSFDPRSSDRSFTIHATDHVVSLLGMAIGKTVAAQAPEVRLAFLPIQSDEVNLLRSGQVDLAIGVFPDLPEEFRTQTLFRERYACVARKGHPKIKGKVTLECFLEMKHVVVAPRGHAGSPVDRVLASRGLKRRAARHVPYFLVALELISRSDCIVTISERLARMYAARFGLQVLSPPIAIPGYTIRQIWHPRVDADPAHGWLRRRVAAASAELSAKS